MLQPVIVLESLLLLLFYYSSINISHQVDKEEPLLSVPSAPLVYQ